jgi:hypothetical protein
MVAGLAGFVAAVDAGCTLRTAHYRVHTRARHLVLDCKRTCHVRCYEVLADVLAPGAITQGVCKMLSLPTLQLCLIFIPQHVTVSSDPMPRCCSWAINLSVLYTHCDRPNP